MGLKSCGAVAQLSDTDVLGEALASSAAHIRRVVSAGFGVAVSRDVSPSFSPSEHNGDPR